MERFFSILSVVDDFFWSHIGFLLVVALGGYFTWRSRGYQFRTLGRMRETIRVLATEKGTLAQDVEGVSPLKLYFASVGGMIGLGNVVGVVTALLIGGPGALFWLWIAALSGMLIKYSEIYLGMRFRIKNNAGSYDGGPMYYLTYAFKSPLVPKLVALLLCIYGVEVYQFLIITDTLQSVSGVEKYWIIIPLLGLVIYTGVGGVNRLATVCTVMMPAFLIGYVIACVWVVGHYLPELPVILKNVCVSAFQGHAAIGGFAGSTAVLAAQNGIARAVYSGDIGIGYDATIQCESQSQYPERQARLAILSLLTDIIICSLSILVVLVTDLWYQAPHLLPSEYVGQALSLFFPHIQYIMPVFFFLAGFTTIVAFFTVGMKCARFLHSKYGQICYIIYAIFAFCVFSYYDQSKVILLMSLSGGCLMLVNLLGIIRLRHSIQFK